MVNRFRKNKSAHPVAEKSYKGEKWVLQGMIDAARIRDFSREISGRWKIRIIAD